jgi:hypothetical protein
VILGSFVEKLKRKNITTDAEALRKDYPQISPMTEIKSLKNKTLKNFLLKSVKSACAQRECRVCNLRINIGLSLRVCLTGLFN